MKFFMGSATESNESPVVQRRLPDGISELLALASAKPAEIKAALTRDENGKPIFDGNALPKELKAMIDYWMAAHWYPPAGPSRYDHMNAFVNDFLSTHDGMTVTLSKTWPGWMVDTLGYAWSFVREKMSEEFDFDDGMLKSHIGAAFFIQDSRPAYGTIEIDYKKEMNAILSDRVMARHRPTNSGLLIKAGFSDYVPSMSIMVHESKREAGERFLAAFAALVEANNIYKSRQLTFAGSRIKFTKIEQAAFDDVIMSENIVKMVRENTVALVDRADTYRKIGMGIGHSTVLGGHPGTGKTMLCRAVASALAGKVTSWVVTAKAFNFSSDVATFYEMARAFAPALVIFEDIDLVGANRSPGNSAHNEVLGELLNQMSGTGDNSEILTVASTNDMSALDAALLDRPERLGTKIDVPLPGKLERHRMFSAFAKRFNAQIELDPYGWDSILNATEGFTGDYIKATIRHAIRAAVNRLPTEAAQADIQNRISLVESDLQAAVAEMLRSRQVGRKPVQNKSV